MSVRQLKKRDKRAAAILLALYPHSVSPREFFTNDGRYVYQWRCSYEYEEWDWAPASEHLSNLESDTYFHNCIDPNTGDMLPDEQCPQPTLSAMHQLPAGWRWRGRRVVPVDKTGAMVRQKGKA